MSSPATELADAVGSPAAPSTTPDSPWLAIHHALGISLMDHLWNRLDGAYPKKWRESLRARSNVYF